MAAQFRRDVRHPRLNDALLQCGVGEGDVQVQAAPLQGVGKLAAVVAGQEHHRRLGDRLDGADLRDGDLIVGEDLQQQGLELVVGLVNLVDQQYAAVLLAQRLEQGARLHELLGEEDVAELVQPVDGFGEALGPLQHLLQGLLQHLGVEQLLAVLPLVDGLGLVQALVALQADQRQLEHRRGGFGQFRLAHSRRPLDQHRLVQVVGQIDRRGDLLAANVAMRLQAAAHRLRVGGHCLDCRQADCLPAKSLAMRSAHEPDAKTPIIPLCGG